MHHDDVLARALTATSGFSATERWSIPIRECGEALRPLSTACEPIEVRPTVPARIDYLAGRGLWARERVVGMLELLAKNVAPEFRLVVVDAYRSIDYQRQRFDQLLGETRSRYPDESEDQLRVRVDRLIAIPEEDPSRPPPHSTGGAVDMMLASTSSGEIDYGSRISCFDDPDENSRHPTNVAGLSADQREARVRLVAAAVQVGFANYPGEWWHFMFGDQEHALTTGAPFAQYGRADELPGSHFG